MGSNKLKVHKQKSCGKGTGQFYCPVCQKVVEGDLKEHIDQCNRKMYHCRCCGEAFNTGVRRTAHEKKCRVADEITVKPKTLKIENISGERTALGGLFRIVSVKPNENTVDFEGRMMDEIQHIADILENRLETGLKFYLSVELNMSKMEEGEDVRKVVNFQTTATMLLQSTNIKEKVEEHIFRLMPKIERYIRNGSGWIVMGLKNIDIMMTTYNPMG